MLFMAGAASSKDGDRLISYMMLQKTLCHKRTTNSLKWSYCHKEKYFLL